MPYHFRVLLPFPPAPPHDNSNQKPHGTIQVAGTMPCPWWILNKNVITKPFSKECESDFCFWPRWSNRFYRFTVLPETTEKQDYLKQWLSIHWTSINERKRLGTNEVNPVIVLDFCLEKVSRPQNEGEIQAKGSELSWGDRAGSPGMPRQLKDGQEEYWSGESRTEDSGDLQKSHLNIQWRTNQCIHMRMTQSQRESPERVAEIMPEVHGGQSSFHS